MSLYILFNVRPSVRPSVSICLFLLLSLTRAQKTS